MHCLVHDDRLHAYVSAELANKRVLVRGGRGIGDQEHMELKVHAKEHEYKDRERRMRHVKDDEL